MFLFISFFVGLDQLSKYFFFDNGFGSSFSLITASFNNGIARSLPVPLMLVIVFSFLFLIFLFCWYRKGLFSFSITAFIAAGTIGNLIDRILYHGVRDFIDLGFFPIFNFADIYLSIGVLLMVGVFLVLNNDGQSD